MFDLKIPIGNFCDSAEVGNTVAAGGKLGDYIKYMGGRIGSAAAAASVILLTAFRKKNGVVPEGLIFGFLPLYGEKDSIDDNIVWNGRKGSDIRGARSDTIQSTADF